MHVVCLESWEAAPNIPRFSLSDLCKEKVTRALVYAKSAMQFLVLINCVYVTETYTSA